MDFRQIGTFVAAKFSFAIISSVRQSAVFVQDRIFMLITDGQDLKVAVIASRIWWLCAPFIMQLCIWMSARLR